MSDTKVVDEPLPTLPQEIILAIAHLSGPVRSRKIRRTCKANLKLITAEDLVWAEAGWRHCFDGFEECWEWAYTGWHTKVIWAYLADVSARTQMDVFHRAARLGDGDMVVKLVRDWQFDHSIRNSCFMLPPEDSSYSISTYDPESPEYDFPRSGQEALLREGLFLAANNDRVDGVRILLELGATDGSLSYLSLYDRAEDFKICAYPNDRAVNCTYSAVVVRLLLAARPYKPTELYLHRLIEYEDVEGVKILLDAGAHLWGGDLGLAAAVGNVTIVHILLEAGADVHWFAEDSFRSTALDSAAGNGNPEVLRALLAAGARVEGNQDPPPLLHAVNWGHTEAVKVLVDAGADVHRDSDKALKLAVESAKVDIVKILLAAGADADAAWESTFSTTWGRDPIEVVKLLLNAGVNVRENHLDSLSKAIELRHGEFVRSLLAAGVPVNLGPGGHLIMAVSGGVVDIVKALLDARLPISIGPNGPLSIAISRGFVDIVRLLVDAGALINTGSHGPLHMAALGGHAEIVKILLDAGADVHVNDEEALWEAVKGSRVEVVKVLLAGGADVNRPRTKYASVRRENRYNYRVEEVMKLLEKARAI
ncbi:hypothetical protein HDV00_009215 [Rhizophlyctis rosea]|nr:hypothetical protein HDV00_009215 [Rhizophlyctis rosea]